MRESCKYRFFAKIVHALVCIDQSCTIRYQAAQSIQCIYIYVQTVYGCMDACMHALSHNLNSQLHQFCFFVALMFTTVGLSVDEGEIPILNLTYEANQPITSEECTGVDLQFFSGQ